MPTPAINTTAEPLYLTLPARTKTNELILQSEASSSSMSITEEALGAFRFIFEYLKQCASSEKLSGLLVNNNQKQVKIIPHEIALIIFQFLNDYSKIASFFIPLLLRPNRFNVFSQARVGFRHLSCLTLNAIPFHRNLSLFGSHIFPNPDHTDHEMLSLTYGNESVNLSSFYFRPEISLYQAALNADLKTVQCIVEKLALKDELSEYLNTKQKATISHLRIISPITHQLIPFEYEGTPLQLAILDDDVKMVEYLKGKMSSKDFEDQGKESFIKILYWLGKKPECDQLVENKATTLVDFHHLLVAAQKERALTICGKLETL